MLLAPENPRGTFLIRNSEHNPNGFSLSVKDWEEMRAHHVKHYKIKSLDNGNGFYIATNHVFPSLQSLVQAYSSTYFLAKIMDHVWKLRSYNAKSLHRKRTWTLSCALESMPETKARNVGLVSHDERPVGDRPKRDQPSPKTWSGQLWRSLAR